MHKTQSKLRQRLTSAIALFTLSAATITALPTAASPLPHCCSTVQLAQGDRARISIPGTSVSLAAPAGFVLSDQFSGLINPENLSSIVIAELPAAAYAELAAVMASTPAAVTAAFAERGISLEVETISTLRIGDAQVPLVEGTQTVGSTQVRKYFTLLGGESTVLLTFNLTESAQLSEATVVDTIRSLDVAAAASIEQKLAELPFSFEVADPFGVFDVLLGSAVLLSPGGELDPTGTAPIVVIATSVSPVQPSDVAAFASQLLQSTEEFSEVSMIAQSPIEFAGGEGYLIQAALEESTVLQYIRILPDDFYIRMLVVGSTQEIADLAPTIQTIQRSVEAKP